jgi:hypothetical protein
LSGFSAAFLSARHHEKKAVSHLPYCKYRADSLEAKEELESTDQPFQMLPPSSRLKKLSAAEEAMLRAAAFHYEISDNSSEG